MGSRSYFCYRDDICYNSITLFGHIQRFSRNRMPLQGKVRGGIPPLGYFSCQL